jgi:hypothetical protein
MKVVLKGWPATIFLTMDTKYMEELATRSFTATPESSEAKILEANVLTNMKFSLPWQYDKETEAFTIIKRLIQILQENTYENNLDVLIPFLNLYELFPKEISRDMRDFQHFCQFLKTVTLLYFLQRAYMKIDGKKILLATLQDIRVAIDIYKEVFETTRTNTEQRTLDFYHNIVKTRPILNDKGEPAKDKDGKPTVDDNPSWYLSQLTTEYNKTAKKKLSDERIRVMLDRLDNIGYVNTQKDSLDKRRNIYIPLIKDDEKDTNPLKTTSWLDLGAKLGKGFELWKENILGTSAFYIYKNNSEKDGTWGEVEVTLEELYGLIIEDRKIFLSNAKQEETRIISDEVSEPKTEIKPKTNHKPNLSLIVDNSNLGMPCPFCKAQGKKMFFASDLDLSTHVSSCHDQPSKTDYVS